MKTLVQGCESAEQFGILLRMTRINSQAKQDALRAYLVEGLPAKRAYARFGVTQQGFSVALRTLNAAAAQAIKYGQEHEINTKTRDENLKESFRRLIEHPLIVQLNNELQNKKG
ncbi:PapB/FocB family fimbrial expression transcriptional regulator [Shewanella ulleungensis]|uniref:PapB/FocB family fimbrial expression transcriptional regulator n=1 Tax=Shewanella ulleungensis TaxID=2282699 RepID=UPI003D793449